MADIAEDVDLLVIGAGIYGIQAARTYLSLHPTHHVVVLESASVPGGAWSTERMYDAFWTQSPVSMWQFSDQALTIDEKERFHEFFPARHFTQYLDDYLDGHVYEGKTLRERIVTEARVERLWKEDQTWMAKTMKGHTYKARKVIDASGQTSIPNIPDVPGSDLFTGEMIHHKEFGRSSILQTCKRVVVLGGAKSAADVAYASAKAGLEVHWVIRQSGNGPCAYFPADSPISYYKDANSMFHHRFMGSLIASIYAPTTWWTIFLHNTAVGRMLLRLIWRGLNNEFIGRASYERKDGKENGFANLKPDNELFWETDSSGLNNRPDFFDTIATKVKVYRQDMQSIGRQDVHLEDGTTIETDAIVFATGWRESTPYINPRTAYALGLATTTDGIDETEEEKWKVLEKAADEQVLQKWPILKSPPPVYIRKRKETPFRLYMAMLPIRDHSIAFLGKMMLANHTHNAEVQALFAVAALDGGVQLPSDEKLEEEVAMVSAWMKRRYPAKAQAGNWYFFDVVPYTDRLLEILGVRSHRVIGWRDWVRPLAAENLSGVLGEYRDGQKGGKKTT